MILFHFMLDVEIDEFNYLKGFVEKGLCCFMFIDEIIY